MFQEDFKTKLYKHIMKLIKSTSFHLEGTETKLTELPHYLIHMSLYKNTYENAIRYIVANNELSIEDFADLATNYSSTGKIEELVDSYKTNEKPIDFSFKKAEFKEYPFYTKEHTREINTALEDLIDYSNKLKKYTKGTSIELELKAIPFLECDFSEEGIVYLFDYEEDALNLEAALLGVSNNDYANSELLDAELERERKEHNKQYGDEQETSNKNNSKRRKISNNHFSAYRDLFTGESYLTQEQARKEAEAYFVTIHDTLKELFPDSYLTSILEPLFKLLLKLEFGNNLSNAITSAKNKYKDSIEKQINNKNIAELINISESTFSNYGNTAFPDVDGLYRIAEVVETSCDTLLGNISQDSTSDEEIYKRYGLYSDTLRHLEQFKKLKDANGTDSSFWLNGLNKCLQSIKYDYLAVGKFKIDISEVEIRQLLFVIQYADEVIADDSIPAITDRGFFIKTSNGLYVKYTKKQRIINDNGIEIKDTPLFTSYLINEKCFTHKKSEEVMYIKYKGITNHVSFKEWDMYFKSDFKRNPPVQYHVIGNEETDFFSAICRFLNKNNIQVSSITQKDFDFMLDECANYNEDTALPDIESFLQDMYSEYGYTKYETDNLNMLEITDKLRRYKENLQ